MKGGFQSIIDDQDRRHNAKSFESSDGPDKSNVSSIKLDHGCQVLLGRLFLNPRLADTEVLECISNETL